MQAVINMDASYAVPRRHPRHKINVNLGVTPFASGVRASGLGNDVSPRGLGLFAPVDLNVGDLIFIQLAIGASMKFELPATVRHRNGFHYGVEFEDSAPSEHDMRNICQMLIAGA